MSKEKLVVATNNMHKLKEIAEIFTEYEVVSQKQMGFDREVEENGTTFSENALIKARAASIALNCIALADDSGLCVDALNGEPGIFSARYSGKHGDDKGNRDLLLKKMSKKSNRNAHFTSAVALVYPNGQEIVAEGKTYGEILQEEAGTGGFGYDCIFFSSDLEKSFGLATSEEKNSVSHRFRALQALREKMQR